MTEPDFEQLEALIHEPMYYLQNKKGDEAPETWNPDSGGLSKFIYDSISAFCDLKAKHKDKMAHLNGELSDKDKKIKQLERELEATKKQIVEKSLEIGEKTARLDEKDYAIERLERKGGKICGIHQFVWKLFAPIVSAVVSSILTAPITLFLEHRVFSKGT